MGGWPASQRTPSTKSARRVERLGSASSSSVALAAARRMTTREISTAPMQAVTAFTENGSAMPSAKRNAPIGGDSSWPASKYEPWRRALAMPRSTRGTIPGRMLPAARLAKTSAVESRSRAARTMATLIAPVATVRASVASTTLRDRSIAMMIRRRSRRSTRTPAIDPSSSFGRYWHSAASETRSGSCVCDAIRSGPAATMKPSPMLFAMAAESSQRKPRPKRAGATTSIRAVTGLGIGRGLSQPPGAVYDRPSTTSIPRNTASSCAAET